MYVWVKYVGPVVLFRYVDLLLLLLWCIYRYLWWAYLVLLYIIILLVLGPRVSRKRLSTLVSLVVFLPRPLLLSRMLWWHPGWVGALHVFWPSSKKRV